MTQRTTTDRTVEEKVADGHSLQVAIEAMVGMLGISSSHTCIVVYLGGEHRQRGGHQKRQQQDQLSH